MSNHLRNNDASDPLSLLRDADPAQGVPGYDDAAAARLIDRAVTTAPRTAPRRRRRPSLAVGAGLAITAAVGGGGVAYAVFFQPAETALQIECAVGVGQGDFERFGSGGTIMSAASGDPVTDCASEFTRLQGQAPVLRAYAHGKSFITVVPADWTVPAQWRPLGQDFRSDPVRLELESRLADQIEGPEAGCLDADAAEQLVQAELVDLQLTGWTVERLSQAARADGNSWCAIAFLETDGSGTVLIQGLEREPDTPGPLDTVVDLLRRDIVEQCLTLPQAISATQEAVQAAGFTLSDAKITSIEDATADCTRVDFVPAGLVAINLRGPAT